MNTTTERVQVLTYEEITRVNCGCGGEYIYVGDCDQRFGPFPHKCIKCSDEQMFENKYPFIRTVKEKVPLPALKPKYKAGDVGDIYFTAEKEESALQNTFKYNVGDTVYYAETVGGITVVTAGKIVDRLIVHKPGKCGPCYKLRGMDCLWREHELSPTAE